MPTILTLAAMLCSGGVPSIASLAEGRHGHHGHSSGHSSGMNPGWLLDDAGNAWVAVELLSKTDLVLELDGLHARWPGMGGSAALITSGIVLVLVGLGFTVAGLVQTLVTGMVTWVLGVGLGAVGLGIVLFIVGVSTFLSVSDTRSRYDYRIKQLEQRLQVLDKATLGPVPSLPLARF